MSAIDVLPKDTEDAWLVEEVDPQQLANEARELLSTLARIHPEFTTNDMVIMQPTMVRLRELSK